jgi:hypothetical protein
LQAVGENDALLIALDDDMLYGHTMVEHYVNWHAKLPDAALALRGHRMSAHVTWAQTVNNNIVHGYELSELTCVDVITGVGSFMVQPRFFTSELWEGMFERTSTGQIGVLLRGDAMVADDVWISGILAKHGIKRYAIPARRDSITPDMELPQYMAGIIVTPHSKRQTQRDHTMLHLGGGSGHANDSLLRLFAPYWDCYGRMDTVVNCEQLRFDKHPHLKRTICRRVDGGIEEANHAWESYYDSPIQ